MGSKRGKTCCRGTKGAGARSGWKSRDRYEGGQLPLYRRLPVRGFSRARFQKRLDSVNLSTIELAFSDGEKVNLATLQEKGFLKGALHGLKILGDGALTKKVEIEANAFSASAKEKLESAGITYSIVK